MYCTLVKINKDEGTPIRDEPPVKTKAQFFEPVSRDLGWDMKPIKTVKTKSAITGLFIFKNFIKSKKINKLKYQLGAIIHLGKTPEIDRNVIFISVNTKSDDIETVNIKNPIHNKRDGVLRNISMKGFTMGLSPSMQSQLFAMLDSSAGDSQLMKAFSIKDVKQKKLYEWEQAAFPRETTLTPLTMGKLMKNVLNAARLPWITLSFEDDGPSCKFAITTSSGTLTPDSKIEGDDRKGDGIGDLGNCGRDVFEKLGVVYDGYKLRISDMRLVIMLSWGMNESVILHELAHYIEFMTPSAYRINKGEIVLSFNEYSILYAGHGACFVSVYARLLIDFYYVDEEWLYSSLSSTDLYWFKLKDLKTETMNLAIKKYILNKRKES